MTSKFIQKRLERFKESSKGFGGRVKSNIKSDFNKAIDQAGKDPRAFFLTPQRPLNIKKTKLKGRKKNKMVARSSATKTNAKKLAKRLRKKGLNASVFKKKKGFGVSSTRK